MEEQSKNAMLHSAHSDITLVNQGLIEVLALKLPVLGDSPLHQQGRTRDQVAGCCIPHRLHRRP